MCRSPRTDHREKSEDPQTLRQVAFGVATFDCTSTTTPPSLCSKLAIWEVRCPASRRFHEPNSGEPSTFSAKSMEKTNIQIPIDAKYVTRSIAHRGDLVQGPNGDLWSILFHLIDERSGVTDFIKVKSHLEDAGPSVIKQNKIAFHHMPANSLADVVAEEAPKRLLPDLNLERKAKWAERVGVGVAKRLALVQEDIWAKRSEAGDIYDATCTRTAFSTPVDELAHQGLLLVRHNKGLRCKVCNMYRAYKQFRFWSCHPCMPRPNAAAVTSHFQNTKRQLINTSAGNSCHVLDQSGARNKTSSKQDEKELLHCTSLGYGDIQCTHSHPEHYPLPISLEPELDLAHTHQCCDYSRSRQDVVQHMVLVAGRPITMCGTSGCSGSCSLSAVTNGYEAGKKPATCQTCGRIFPRPNSRNVSPVTSRRSRNICLVSTVKCGFLERLTARSSGAKK